MIQRVTLPIDTIDVLKQFGDIDVVVDKILQLVEQNVIPIDNLPNANTVSQKCKKISINIINKTYIDMRENGDKFSLARLLQYFVDNELYAELDWQTSDIVDTTKQAIVLALLHAESLLTTAAAHTIKHSGKFRAIINSINDLTKEIENEHDV